MNVLEDPRTARTLLGLAGQFAAVDEFLTGRENVYMIGQLYNLPSAVAKARTDEILERIGLAEAANRPVRTYSGGMRRRLDLAASMVGRPKVLFMDEPTTGIDPRSRIEVWNMIGELVAGGTSILLTTQYLDEADQLAARVAVIDQGQVISEGTPAELKSRLGGAVVELSVSDDCREATIRVLSTLDGADPTFEPSTKRITVPAPDGANTLTRVVQKLSEAQITPEDITLRQPTLDDVFLALTGRVAVETSTNGETEETKKRRRFSRSRPDAE